MLILVYVRSSGSVAVWHKPPVTGTRAAGVAFCELFWLDYAKFLLNRSVFLGQNFYHEIY